jgi:hypothetical protein
MIFTIHHFAYLTNNIDISIEELKVLGFEQESVVSWISTQKVSVCFLINQDNIRYELVQPAEDNTSLQKLISNGITLYHTGYLVASFQESADYLIEKGYFQINNFKSEAFKNKTCAFFVSRSKKLIELIEL